MAITASNKTKPGVEEILAQSAMAIDDFSQSALNGTTVLNELKADIIALQDKENALLARFGGLEGLKARIAQFKADAGNFAGKGLLLNLTLPFSVATDEELKKAQDNFEKYIIGTLVHELGEEIVQNLTAQDLFRFLNLEDLGLSSLITVMVSEKGATVKGFKRKSGGQFGSKNNNQALSEFMVKKSSSALINRINQAANRIKRDLKKEGIELESHTEIQANHIKIYAGTKWAQLTSRGGKGGIPLSESEARNNSYVTKNLNNINRQIKNEIRSQLNINSNNSRAFDLVMNHMLNQNPYMFFVGKNSNQITGLIGEITAMILFYDLIHSYPSVQWAAQHTGLSGTQASADIIINDGYGIQVKNSTSDFGMIENEAQELTIGFSDVSFSRLGDVLGFYSDPIENLYDAREYNVSYEWGDGKRKKGGGTFREGSNAGFSGVDSYIDELITRFEDLMTMYSSALLYMDNVRGKETHFYSGDIGNVLYMVNLVPFVASDMLQKIVDAIEGKGTTPLVFSVSQRKAIFNGDITNDINPNPHQFFSEAGTEITYGPNRAHSRYFKTSYTFRY